MKVFIDNVNPDDDARRPPSTPPSVGHVVSPSAQIAAERRARAEYQDIDEAMKRTTETLSKRIDAVTVDDVNHPTHYTSGDIECIDAIEAALTPEAFVGFCKGNAMKYIWRAGLKDDAAKDLRKAVWYLDRAAVALDD